MATGVVLDPDAQARAKALKTALAKDFGVAASERDIVSAAVYGATAAQLVGMLLELTKIRAARDESADAQTENRTEPTAG